MHHHHHHFFLVLPSGRTSPPLGAQTPRHALRPGPTNSGFECHQVIRFVVSPCCSLTHQERMQQQPRHVTRRVFPFFPFSVPYRTVPPSCQPALRVGAATAWPGYIYHTRSLSPAGRENPGPCVSPVGRRFWDVVSRRADPDRQSDDGGTVRSLMPPCI